MKKNLISAMLTGIISFSGYSNELPQIIRENEIEYLSDVIWGSRAFMKQRYNSSSENNYFFTHQKSFDQETLRALVEDYKDFFSRHQIDVEIEDNELSQELLLQIESLATFIESTLIMPRMHDYLMQLTYLRTNRTLFGGLVINHKFKIKKARKNKIEFSIEMNKPTITISYSNFIDKTLLKTASQMPIEASKSKYYSHYADQGSNLSRFILKYAYNGQNGLRIIPTAELGYLNNKDGDFVHIMSTEMPSQKIESFNSPDKIDRALINKYFARVCDGLGIVYLPANLFLNFPQLSIQKHTNEFGITVYRDIESNYEYKENELPAPLKRGYQYYIENNCKSEDVKRFNIKLSSIDSVTGLSFEFIDYVSQKSMFYRFNDGNTDKTPLEIVTELQCPQGKICFRDGKNYDQDEFSSEAKSKLKVLRQMHPEDSKLTDLEILKKYH